MKNPWPARVGQVLIAALAFSSPLLGQQGRVLEDESFYSSALGSDLSYSIYLPPGYEGEERVYPVVYLLHGYGGDHTNWAHLGGAALAADSLIASGASVPLVLVMPDGQNSFYVDSDPAVGFGAMESAMAEDLIAHIDGAYRTIPSRGGRMIAGLSMGGYGAVHLAFKYPEWYGGAASLSGAHPRDPQERLDLFSPAFGDPFDPHRWAEESPFGLIAGLKDSRLAVPVYLTVGDDDAPWIVESVTDLYRSLRAADLPAELRVTDGAHGWDVWREALPQVLLFFTSVWSDGQPRGDESAGEAARW